MTLYNKIKNLCWKIEDLPPSELQTEIIEMATAILKSLEWHKEQGQIFLDRLKEKREQ